MNYFRSMSGNLAKRPKNTKKIFLLPTLTSATLWLCNLDNIQRDSQTELVDLKRFVPLHVYYFIPLLWSFGQYLALIGFLILFIAICLSRRIPTLRLFGCLLLWALLFSLHYVNLKSSLAAYIGLYKEDLYTLQFVTSSCLTLISFSMLILPQKRKHICRLKKKNRRYDPSATSELLSNCTSFACSQCSCSSAGCNSNGPNDFSAKDFDSGDENSPSRILGAKLSSLNLGSNSGGRKSCDTSSMWSCQTRSTALTRRSKTAVLLAPAKFVPSKGSSNCDSSVAYSAASDACSRDLRRKLAESPTGGYPKSECSLAQLKYRFSDGYGSTCKYGSKGKYWSSNENGSIGGFGSVYGRGSDSKSGYGSPGGYGSTGGYGSAGGYGSVADFFTATNKPNSNPPESCYKSFWTSDEDTISLLSGGSSSRMRRLTPFVKNGETKLGRVSKNCMWKTLIGCLLFGSLLANFVILYFSFYVESF